jgi:hypothetical protein
VISSLTAATQESFARAAGLDRFPATIPTYEQHIIPFDPIGKAQAVFYIF